MKKIKLIVLILIISLMLTGTGYAILTDKLTINNTVSTGELNVKFVKETNAKDNSIKVSARGSEYVVPVVQIVDENAHTVKIELSNLYPGAWAAFRLKGVNVGTIPIDIENIQVSFSGDIELLKYLTYEAGLSIDRNGDNVIDYTTGSFSGKLEKIEEDFNNKIKVLKNSSLEPTGKGSLYFETPNNSCNGPDLENERYIFLHFDSRAGNDTQKKTLEFTIKTNFKQHI